MTTTTNLLITHIEPSQAQKEVTANEAFDRLDAAIAGRLALSTTGGTTTLTDAQASNAILDVSGALTSNAVIVVPARSKLYAVRNATTGAFSLTVKTASGTGVTVRQGESAIVFCDGTNVITGTTAQMADHLAASDPHPQYATDADLSAHLTDTTAAHDASAVGYRGVDVQAALDGKLTFADLLNDRVVSGLSAPTSTTLDTTIAAGVAYISGLRVATSAQTYTYAASSDTYVDLSSAGVFTYTAVANAAAAPAVAASSLRLLKVVTDATTVTTVTPVLTKVARITRLTVGNADSVNDPQLVIKQNEDTILGGFLCESSTNAGTGGMYHNGTEFRLRESGVDCTAFDAGVTKALGQFQIVDADARIKRIAQGLYLENVAASSTVAGLSSVNAAANATWDGTNWNRIDTAQPASLHVVDRSGALNFYTAAAGANPIAWSGPYPVIRGGMSYTDVKMSANQSIAAATFTKVAFDTVNSDIRSNYDSANYRFVVPEDGVYDISATVIFLQVPDGSRSLIEIYRNGARFRRGSDKATGALSDLTNTVGTTARLATTDYIEVYTYCSAAVSLASNAGLSWFSVSRVQ